MDTGVDFVESPGIYGGNSITDALNPIVNGDNAEQSAANICNAAACP